MANLVDDYKNFIPYEVPNGVRIRDGVITVPNGSNEIAPLDIWEGIVCYSSNVTLDDRANLFFTPNITGEFIIFKIPFGNPISNGTDFTSRSPRPNDYVNAVNSMSIELWPYTFGMDGSGFIYNIMRWLILRIA